MTQRIQAFEVEGLAGSGVLVTDTLPDATTNSDQLAVLRDAVTPAMLGSDGVHPNDYGMTYLADQYVAALSAAGKTPAAGTAIAAYGDSWTGTDTMNTPGKRAIQQLVNRLSLGTLTNYAVGGDMAGDGSVRAVGTRGTFPAGTSGLVVVGLGLNDLQKADTAQQRAVTENYLRALFAVICAAERIEQGSFTFGTGWTLNGSGNLPDFSGGSNRYCTAEGATATYNITTPGTYYLLVSGLDGTSTHRGGVLTISQGGTTLATVDQDAAMTTTTNLLTSFYGPLSVRLNNVQAGTLTISHSQAGRGASASSFVDALVRISSTPPTILAVKPVRILTIDKPDFLAAIRTMYDTMATEFGANVVVCDPAPGWAPEGIAAPPDATSELWFSDGTAWTRPTAGTPEPASGPPAFDIVDYGAAVDNSTDDTAAVQATMDAIAAAGGGRMISSKPGICLIAGPLRDTSGANAQLLLPSIDAVDSEQITIVIEGTVPPPTTFSVIGATPVPDNHLVLRSTLNAGAGGAVIGGHGPVGTFENFTNLFVQLKNLTVRLPSNPVLTGLNLAQVACVDLDNVVVDCGNYYVQGLTQPTTASSYGIRLPANNNGAYTRLGAVNVIGFYTGYQFAEHTVGQQVNAWGCQRAFEFVATNHASKFQRLMAVHCPKGMVFTGTHYVDVDQFNIEHATSGWWVTTADIDDPSNYGHGTITWHVVKAGVGIDATFTKNGATGITANRVGTAPSSSGSAVVKGRDRLTAAAGDITLTLGATPVAKSPLVWVNGAIKWPSVDYTISGAVITFTSALAAGDVVSVIYDTLTADPAASTLSHSTAVTIADTFDRANSTSSLGSTSTGSAAWTAYRGTWGISSNRAYLSAGHTSSVNLAAVESGKADCTVQITLAAMDFGEQPGLYLRASDGNNGYVFEGGSSSGTAKLYKWAGGAATVIGQTSGGAYPLGAGDQIQAVMSGSSIIIKRNGTTIITATDSTFATQTRHGLYVVSGSSSNVRFDDFTVSA